MLFTLELARELGLVGSMGENRGFSSAIEGFGSFRLLEYLSLGYLLPITYFLYISFRLQASQFDLTSTGIWMFSVPTLFSVILLYWSLACFIACLYSIPSLTKLLLSLM